jgi:superfamily II DNA/RNA helicase
MDVDHVIQFEFAKNITDYIHRVGRTGRMGQKGYVTNFIRKGDQELVLKLKEHEENREPFDKLLSRKRSFRKNIKKQGSQLSEGYDSDEL